MTGETDSGPLLSRDDFITYRVTTAYYRGLGAVDPFVRWKLDRAFQSFQGELYDSCIIFLAAALEEELARLYVDGHVEQLPDEKTGKAKEIVDVTCQALLDHAEKIIPKTDKTLYESILIARNYHAHSHRRMRSKTRNRIEEQKYIRYWRKKTGAIDERKPYLGWLDSQKCSLVALENVVNLLRITTQRFPIEGGEVEVSD